MNETSLAGEFEELLLQSARNGDYSLVKELLQAKKEKRISVDINCKGRVKSNLGWTPLHLACYFGHESVVELLLQNGANVNVINEAGDTPLHKAAFTGRESIVILLLKYNADVSTINGEGQTPRNATLAQEIRNLIEGAEKTEVRKKEDQFLHAAREGNLEVLNALLTDPRPPNINCCDIAGNTALHCAAYRERKEAVVILLQNGIDSTIRNKQGHTALQLAQTVNMRQILDVQPIKKIVKHVMRFEGLLSKRSRFLGWQNVWVVLERGVMTYFKNRADACSGVKRKGFKHLDDATAFALTLEPNVIVVHFNDNTMHRLSLPQTEENGVGIQKWLNALREHIDYCTHYMNQGLDTASSDEEDQQEVLPLGSMQDALKTAQAHEQILKNEIAALSSIIPEDKSKDNKNLVHKKLRQITSAAQTMMSSLNHCMTIFTQQEELRVLQMKNVQEKCRVLQHSLHVLAKEHHELEQSIVTSPFHTPKSRSPRSPRFYDTSDDEFYDAFDEVSDLHQNASSSSEGDKSDKNDKEEADPSQSSGPSKGSSQSTSASSTSTVTSDKGRRGTTPIPKLPRHDEGRRTQLPVPMFARNDYSIWSILKHCIGKELSKITFPIIFNEPLSFLQRMSEYMEYDYLLKEASNARDPVDRIQYVTAFAVSALAANWERTGKPFNPLLGETFELEREDYHLICEQVSHHPPISAFHAHSPDFIFHGSIHPKLKFWGKSVEIQPKGVITVQLPKHDEAYTWTNVNCCIHNIIVGKLWIEQYGVLEVVNHKIGLKCTINFKPAGWFSKDLHKVEGFITDKTKKKHRFLYGKWTDFLKSVDMDSYDEYMKTNPHRIKSNQETPRGTPNSSPAHMPKKSGKSLLAFNNGGPSNSNGFDEAALDDAEEMIPRNPSVYSLDIPNSTMLWEVTPRPPDCDKYYQFTQFAMTLNEMEHNMEQRLAPTDCRFRPDIRKLEQGDIDGAAQEKTRLEEKQRDARKSRKDSKSRDKDSWKPQWFELGSNPHTKDEDWNYRGGYWDKNFANCPDIF